MTGNLGFRDDDQIAMGQSSDLQMYHNGTNSIIDNNTGDLYIGTTALAMTLSLKLLMIFFIKPRTGENGIQVLGDGAVKLAYNNDSKFETKSSGVDVTGTTTSDVVNGTLNMAHFIEYGGLFGQMRVSNLDMLTSMKQHLQVSGDTNMNIAVNNNIYIQHGG